ncbi:FecR family protein [Parabacteroides sp. Marseille-P3160]|uniref:FecR family protein n=1 Tax=Parabacteroides sp. Marseille-P3160 TaxID=1917887 RepID=UPI0009B995BF|nr:FecR domain-containing protein [Parabacteroides sp. Marseille-P3160]
MNEQIEKYFQGELSINERFELLKKIESDKNLQAEFTRYQNAHALLSLSDTVINEEDSKRGYGFFMRRIKTQNLRRIVRQTIGYAAAIAFIIISVHLYHIYNYSLIRTASSDVSLYVPAGQRVSMTLQDGTVVWLNAQTKLTYPTAFTGDERRVEVEGEAYFEVAKDAEKPFIVSSKGINMKVLGTTFNVYSYPEEKVSRISLIEGSLQVYFSGMESKGIILRPNEQVAVNEKNISVETIPHADYFLWKEGIYSFYNEPLSNILKRLELYYDIGIEVKDPSILEWEYTGKFRQRDGIDEILRLMQRIHAFRAIKDEENNKITLSK